MRYIYGPVNSRRLGLSLGITLTPHKVCNFDCVYCQLGRTKAKAAERQEYIRLEDVYGELAAWFQNNPDLAQKLQFITISGSGEPTLNSMAGELIDRIKKTVQIPLCLITNSSLFDQPQVRREVLGADLLIPSLDAVEPSIFREIDRPQDGIRIENIIEGLINLRQEYKGKIWLEVMLVKGLNDDLRQIEKLREVIERIRPDKIQLNSPVRSPAEEAVLALEIKKLEKIKDILGDKCEII